MIMQTVIALVAIYNRLPSFCVCVCKLTYISADCQLMLSLIDLLGRLDGNHKAVGCHCGEHTTGLLKTP